MKGRLLAFSRFLLGIIVVLAANFLALLFAPQSGSLRRFDLAYRPLLLLFVLTGFSIVIAGFDRVPGNPFVSIGLAMRPPWLRDLWVGSLLGAGMVALAVTVIAVAGTLTIKVVTSSHTARLAIAEVIILATGAMAEEVSFRGYPFQRLLDAVGPTAAVAMVSILFGAAHLWNPHASALGYLNTVLIGMLLALSYLRTRSLWMPIAIHFWWNATLGLIFGLPVSGLTQFSVITRARADGPVWLTGGSYGIEASALGAIVVALGIGLVLLIPSRRATTAHAIAGATQELTTVPESDAARKEPITFDPSRQLPAPAEASSESAGIPGAVRPS